MSLIEELKRRNVFRVGVAYVIIAWLLLQVSDTLVPALYLPEWFHSAVALLLILGFPLALFFAWAFELTPDGLKKEKDVERSESITHVTGRKLDFVIIAMLVVALGYFGYDKFVLSPLRDAELVQTTTDAVTEPAISQNPDRSIAVLAFADLSPEADQEYFSEGISEEILNLLAKVPELRVTARTSSFSFKDQNLEIPVIAERLHVAHVLEGSVRKAGNRVRITVQLIKADDGFHVWSETYDRTLDDIFQIQDEIGAKVVDALKISLLGEAPKATETSPDAYALYLQARHSIKQYTVESHEKAETLLTQVLKIDSSFAPAWTELGNVYNNQANMFAVRPVNEAVELAREAIQRALDEDPQYAPAYAALGDLDIHYTYDLTAASELMQRALALNPGDTYILGEAAHLECMFDRIDECINLYRQVVTLDPLSPRGHINLGYAYFKANRLEEATNSIQLGLSLNPGQGTAHYRLAFVLLAQGDAPGALVAIEQETIDWRRLHGMVFVQHALGNVEASDATLNEFIEKFQPAADYQIAQIYAVRGEIDLAFEWLDKAYDNRDTGLPFMLGPLFDNLHDDPRWPAFLDKMGLPH